MSKSRPKRIARGPSVDKCYNRMVEMMGLLTETQSADVRTEYSALMCAAAATMAVAGGIEPTRGNCAIILRVMAGEIIPKIEELVNNAV